MKLIIFDCDGTIADSQHMISAAMIRAFETHNLSAPARIDIIGVVGLSLDVAISQLLTSPDPALVGELTQSYKNAFTALRANPDNTEPLFPGARETIIELAARDDVVLGIATGKSNRGVVRLLDNEQLTGHFITVQTADDHPSKPHPSMITAAMARAGTTAANTVMIGDTTFDIDMAVNADVGAIGVSWGYHPIDELHRSGAHAVINDFNELSGALEDVFAQRAEAAA